MDRRSFLATAGTLTTASLAGCSAFQPESSSQSGEAPKDEDHYPTLPENITSNWELLLETPQSFTLPVIESKRKGWLVQYGNSALQSRLREWTLGAFDKPVQTVFATKFNLGVEASLVSGSMIADQAEEKVLGQLKRRGIENIEEIGLPSEWQSATNDGEVRVFRGEYIIPEFSVPFNVPDVGTREFTFKERAFPIEIAFKSWVEDGSAMIAGGAYPAENFAVTGEPQSITGGGTGKGVDASISVNLELEPDRYRETTVKAVENTT